MMDHVVHVIDDDREARRAVSFLLSSLGLRCLEYRSGQHFLDQLSELPPGCVLLDMLMPGASGLDVQAALIARSIDWPVIFISGQEAAAPVVTAVRRGAVDYLAKPYSEDGLLAALHQGFLKLRTSGAPPQQTQPLFQAVT